VNISRLVVVVGTIGNILRNIFRNIIRNILLLLRSFHFLLRKLLPVTAK